MSDRKERESGYYFVKIKPTDDWEIGRYHYGYWRVLFDYSPYEDTDFAEIDERRIERVIDCPTCEGLGIVCAELCPDCKGRKTIVVKPI